VSSPTSSGGPSTNPFLSSPTAAATASNTTQPIVDLFGSLPATADTSQVIIQNYRPDFNITLIGDGQLFNLRIFGGQVQQTGQPHKKVSALKGLLLIVISYICLYLMIKYNRLESLIRKFLYSKDCYILIVSSCSHRLITRFAWF